MDDPGTIIGGRLGYVLFYKLAEYADAPWRAFYVWEGGMSFHGGFIGVVLAMVWYAWRHRQHWLAITDFIAPLVPIGLGAGRLGNFINAELWGRPAEVPWAMIFPSVDGVPRHPSQLYEFALEGVVLFALLWWFSSKPRPRGAVSAAFLIGYGVFRFAVEFTREPDRYLGLLALGFSMGQWLSIPMVIAGIALMIWAYGSARSLKLTAKTAFHRMMMIYFICQGSSRPPQNDPKIRCRLIPLSELFCQPLSNALVRGDRFGFAQRLAYKTLVEPRPFLM